jgi:succinyl-diaminopimelate desuccinylase
MARALAVQDERGAAASVLDLTRELVRIPSPVGSPGARKVLDAVGGWLREHGLEHRTLRRGGAPIALAVELDSGLPGPALALNACADTAPVGDRRAWTVDPFGGELIEDWLYGRGSADSKAGIAVFCHVLDHWARAGLPAGRLLACFDADEHTGRFNGIRTFFDHFPDISATMIGYPGQDVICTGARGFWRGSITVYGVGQHSGSRRPPLNAIVKAVELVRRLNELAHPAQSNATHPQLTITGIRGGAGYTMVPDRCVVRVDVRLTRDFNADWAERVVRRTMRQVDERFPYERVSALRRYSGWPAYELSGAEPVVAALSAAAHEVLGRTVPSQIAGPSNVGNFFAAHGVPATCGFGVVHQGIHAPDEAFEVASIEPTLAVYRRSVARFLSGTSRSSEDP